ncbi:hypothetical protein [Mycobacterium sp.]|uniref:hypothetical protein n=1 Tax=Mycobacterium sp. TaxID=1785 RepID=UPI003BAAFB91
MEFSAVLPVLSRALAVISRWAMLAHAFLAVAIVTERDIQPSSEELITLTVNEFRRLFDALLLIASQILASPVAW